MDAKLRDLERTSEDLFSLNARLSTNHGPLQSELIASIRELLSVFDKELEVVRTYVEEEDDPDQRRSQKLLARKYGEDLKTHRALYHEAVLVARKALSQARPPRLEGPVIEREMATSGRKRKRKDENASNAVLQSSSDVTAALRKTHSLLSEELYKSAYSQELLTQSTQTLTQLNEEYSVFGSILVTSKQLIKELESADRIDQLYIWGSFSFFCAVVVWVVYRRILSRPVNALLWTGSFMFSRLGRGKIIEHTIRDKRVKGNDGQAIVDLAIPVLGADSEEQASLLENARVREAVVLQDGQEEFHERDRVHAEL